MAVKKGVEVRVCGKEMVPDLPALCWKLACAMDCHPSAGVFSNMLDNLGEHARLYMAFYEGAPIAGTLAIWYGDKVVSLRRFLQRTPQPHAQLSATVEYDPVGYRKGLPHLATSRCLQAISARTTRCMGCKFKKGLTESLREFVGELDLVLNHPVHFAVGSTNLFKELRKRVFLRKNRTNGRSPLHKSRVPSRIRSRDGPGNKTDADGAQAPGQSREHGAPPAIVDTVHFCIQKERRV